jgi:hypothetical protein
MSCLVLVNQPNKVASGTSPSVDGQVFNIFLLNIKNLVSVFKHGNSRQGALDDIFQLNKDNRYEYIQDNVFP